PRARAPLRLEESGITPPPPRPRPPRRVEIRRLDECGVELDAVADVDLPELRRTKAQRAEFRLERRVVHQRPEHPILRQPEERDRRRHAEPRVGMDREATGRRQGVVVPAGLSLWCDALDGSALR